MASRRSHGRCGRNLMGSPTDRRHLRLYGCRRPRDYDFLLTRTRPGAIASRRDEHARAFGEVSAALFGRHQLTACEPAHDYLRRACWRAMRRACRFDIDPNNRHGFHQEYSALPRAGFESVCCGASADIVKSREEDQLDQPRARLALRD